MLSRIERIKLDIKNYRDKLPVCDECGERLGYNSKDNGHNPLCSKFIHYVDDHYDSPCMRGTCKYCNEKGGCL